MHPWVVFDNRTWTVYLLQTMISLILIPVRKTLVSHHCAQSLTIMIYFNSIMTLLWVYVTNPTGAGCTLSRLLWVAVQGIFVETVLDRYLFDSLQTKTQVVSKSSEKLISGVILWFGDDYIGSFQILPKNLFDFKFWKVSRCKGFHLKFQTSGEIAEVSESSKIIEKD